MNSPTLNFTLTAAIAVLAVASGPPALSAPEKTAAKTTAPSKPASAAKTPPAASKPSGITKTQTAAAQEKVIKEKKSALDSATGGTKADASKPAAEKKPGILARIFGSKSKKEEEPVAAESASGQKPPRPDNWEGRHIVTDKEIPAYSYGPSQATGADEWLKQGTLVKMKKAGKGWSEVELDDGRAFVVSTDQIRPAKLTDFAEPVRATASQGASQYYEPLPPPNLPESGAGGAPVTPDLLLPPVPE
jgi:hypothetical protein